jgi:hypothetical protein
MESRYLSETLFLIVVLLACEIRLLSSYGLNVLNYTTPY